MTINATELVNKVNFVMSSRKLKEKQYIEEYPSIPVGSAQEEEVIQQLIFSFIKKLFIGCKIRTNANSFSLRLDGHIHRKANKMRSIYNNDQEWKIWFESNHSRIFRIMRDNRSTWNSGVVERREVEGKIFLYVPHKPNRINSYVNYGLVEFCNAIEQDYKRDENLAGVYEEAIHLMEEEIARKERERRERIERELNEYKQGLHSRLYKPIAPLQESDNATDRLFAQKFSAWARENRVAPEYVIPATFAEMVPTQLKVKIMAPPGSEEEGWLALPPFEGYPELPGYEMQGWGKVSGVDGTSERSRGGLAPIIIQDYIYAEFHMEHWNHLLPAGYQEALEVSIRLRQEAEAEIEPWLEQERQVAAQRAAEELQRQTERAAVMEQERLQLEEQVRQQAAESARRTEEAAARQAQLAEQLRQQLTAQPVSMPDVDVDFFDEEEGATPVAEPGRATAMGIYSNALAIPLERYVAIRPDGTTRRFRTARAACDWMGYDYGSVFDIHNYHTPHEVVEHYTHTPEELDELPF